MIYVCIGGCSGDEHVKAAKNDDFDDDDSFGDGDSATADESGVQLGTVVPLEGPPESVLFRNVDWHDWDGGKAGGWPVRWKCWHNMHYICERLVLFVFVKPRWPPDYF